VKTDYQTALRQVLVFEGGRVDDPQDPGGRTNHGVTQYVYDAYRRNNRLPARDVWQIPDAEVAAIYQAGYADKVWFDRLPAGVDVGNAWREPIINTAARQEIDIRALQASVVPRAEVQGLVRNGERDNDLIRQRIERFEARVEKHLDKLDGVVLAPAFARKS